MASRVTRRDFLCGLAGVSAGVGLFAAWSLRSSSEALPLRPVQIGFLVTGVHDMATRSNLSSTVDALQELGYRSRDVAGWPLNPITRTPDATAAVRNPVTFVVREADPDPIRSRTDARVIARARLADLAIEMVAMRPDVIICQTPHVALALKRATSTIPVVFCALGIDPVEWGIVASHARPGGNITGLSAGSAEVCAKPLQFLKEIVPTISRVAAIRDRDEPSAALGPLQRAAEALDIEIVPLSLQTIADLDPALEAAVAARSHALMQLPSANYVFRTHESWATQRIAAFARVNRLPSIVDPKAGGLLNYTAVLVDPWRRLAGYVDRILRGVRPGDLPVEGPTQSAFVVNMCTAAELGVTVPKAVLRQTTGLIWCSS